MQDLAPGISLVCTRRRQKKKETNSCHFLHNKRSCSLFPFSSYSSSLLRPPSLLLESFVIINLQPLSFFLHTHHALRSPSCLFWPDNSPGRSAAGAVSRFSPITSTAAADIQSECGEKNENSYIFKNIYINKKQKKTSGKNKTKHFQV